MSFSAKAKPTKKNFRLRLVRAIEAIEAAEAMAAQRGDETYRWKLQEARIKVQDVEFAL